MITLIAHDRKAGNAFYTDAFGRLGGLTHDLVYATRLTQEDLDRALKHLNYVALNVTFDSTTEACTFLKDVRNRSTGSETK